MQKGWVFLLLMGMTACAPATSPVPAETGSGGTASVGEPKLVSGECPQKRQTARAPSAFFNRTNPLPLTPENLQKGENLYLQTAKPLACKICHGESGNGQGDPDFASTPPARNFTCGAQMNGIPDGQLFWIIRNGSPGTAMPAHPGLSEDEIWKLVLYIRSLSGA
jgi:mono/diheme cytochrome c family protein